MLNDIHLEPFVIARGAERRDLGGVGRPHQIDHALEDAFAVGEVPCLVEDPQGGRRYVNVQADLDEDLLRKIAESTGARYFRATDSDGFKGAFTEIDALEKTEMESRVRVLYTEKFVQALVPAGLLLALETLLVGTRLRRIP